MSTPNAFTGARPKRAGDDFSRTHQSDPDDHSSKKIRFDPRFPSTLVGDAPDEDPVLELDEIGKSGGIKRNAVNIDGYESDSSTENFDLRAKAKAKEKAAGSSKPQDDSDDDMFGNDDDKLKDTLDEEDDFGKKKEVRFLETDEIEGQESTSKSGGHVSANFTTGGFSHAVGDESSSDTGDDEKRDALDSDMDEELGAGGKKKHAPKLDAFNMKSEEQEGRFDEHGNYVRKAVDPNAKYDTWLEGIPKKDIKKAYEAHRKREEMQRKRDLADDSITTSELLTALLTHMEKDETVLESLQRLNKNAPKKVAKWKKGKKANVDIEMSEEEAVAKEAARKEAIDTITDAAAKLMTRGDRDIYEAEFQLLQRQYKRETGEDWVDRKKATASTSNTADHQWEFQWIGAAAEEVHGPYDKSTMASWQEAGYFATNGAQFRRVGDTDWTLVADFQ